MSAKQQLVGKIKKDFQDFCDEHSHIGFSVMQEDGVSTLEISIKSPQGRREMSAEMDEDEDGAWLLIFGRPGSSSVEFYFQKWDAWPRWEKEIEIAISTAQHKIETE